MGNRGPSLPQELATLVCSQSSSLTMFLTFHSCEYAYACGGVKLLLIYRAKRGREYLGSFLHNGAAIDGDDTGKAK
jgi:hypothetical protein